MKVAINVCYGGFSLSPRAVARLAELRGQPCYFFTWAYGNKRHKPLTLEQASDSHGWSAYTVPNPHEVVISEENWAQMTFEEKDACNASWNKIRLEQRPDNRADPLLVQAIEELGDAANGSCAKLKIVEIPDGVKWDIEEYDGNEHIAESHRSWS